MLIHLNAIKRKTTSSHLPPHFEVTKNGGKFRHVGIGLRLYSAPIGLCYFLRWHHPDIFYVKEEGFIRFYWRAIRDNFIPKFHCRRGGSPRCAHWRSCRKGWCMEEQNIFHCCTSRLMRFMKCSSGQRKSRNLSDAYFVKWWLKVGLLFL